MAGSVPLSAAALGASRPARRSPTSEPALVKTALVLVAVLFCALFLVLPLCSIFYQAFQSGWAGYKESLLDPDAIASIKLTLLTAAIAVPLNVVFGIAAAWVIAKFHFKGKNVLVTLIDLPFAVSPVIAGLIFVLLFGREGLFYPLLAAHDIRVIYAVPGIVLATVFVTFPFVARELIPIMEAQGVDEEQAAMVLGASGWQTFWRVTLPNVKWGLLYGVILCNARAMGEFGAVSVVSGSQVGLTNTMPLQVSQYYNDFNFVAAFTLSSLLSMLALVTLIVKNAIEWRTSHQARANEALAESALQLEFAGAGGQS